MSQLRAVLAMSVPVHVTDDGQERFTVGERLTFNFNFRPATHAFFGTWQPPYLTDFYRPPF